jgi:energy-coupling factor transporter transmembrane protein EcfT
MKLKTMKSIMGWVIILLTIFSAVLIYFFQQFNILFLALLLFEIILVIRYRKIFSPLMIRVSQILIGLLFLFSGFSKAVDPLGTAYRIGDYLTAYHMKNDFGITIFLSFVLNTAELLLGGLLLLNIKPKITPWLVALMMGIFTLTTWYDAIYSPVPDCGCFGDAVIMTNWQTYYKNLAINVFVLIVIFGRLKIKSFFGNIIEWGIALLLAVIFVGFQYSNYIDLPMLDFRPYKIGNRIYPENLMPVKTYLTYRNKNTGETKEYLSPNYPFDDQEWIDNWEFVDMRVEDPNKMDGINLAIIDLDGEDITQTIVQNPDYQFFNYVLKKSFIKQLFIFAKTKTIQCQNILRAIKSFRCLRSHKASNEHFKSGIQIPTG